MGQGQFGAKYLIMEVHYDNPDHLSGMNDTSGMEVCFNLFFFFSVPVN